MIYESWPWKRELLRDADILERWCAQKPHSDRRDFLVERKVFLAAYAVRKLIESYKLTDKIKTYHLDATYFDANGKESSPLNWHRINEFFNMENPRSRSLSLRAVSNQIIHSYVFLFAVDEDDENLQDSNDFPITGFYVASDWEKQKRLYQIQTSAFIILMREVGNDSVTNARWWREGDKWKTELS